MARKPDRLVRIALNAGVLIVALGCMIGLSRALMAQLFDLGAETEARNGRYGLAARKLEQAVTWQDGDPWRLKRMGDMYRNMAREERNGKKVLNLLLNARSRHQQALELHGRDARLFYSAARTEMDLYRIRKFLNPLGTFSTQPALSALESASRLRPNGLSYLFSKSVFLHECWQTAELLPVVERMMRTYPPVYHYIKKSPFWSKPVEDACVKGVRDAIARNIAPRHAHMALSSLMAASGQWEDALAHYQTAMTFQAFQNNSDNQLYLGYLYLRNGRAEDASDRFIKGLRKSDRPETHLQRVYGWYKKAERLDDVARMLETVQIPGIREAPVTVFRARALLETGREDEADRLLTDLIDRAPEPEAFYWLARVAEKKKDWHRMEIFAQKAAFRDPSTSKYHSLFSRSLAHRNRLAEAEEEARLALDTAEKANPWLFNHRGWIRWRRKNVEGAVEDWLQAIRLRPERAGFYAQVGAAYDRMEKWPLAEKYYMKALALNPDKADYRKRLQNIRQRLEARHE